MEDSARKRGFVLLAGGRVLHRVREETRTRVKTVCGTEKSIGGEVFYDAPGNWRVCPRCPAAVQPQQGGR